jgi:predicted RNA-binding protein YlxR (DUF448 family)
MQTTELEIELFKDGYYVKNSDGKYAKIKVCYHKGGINYFTGGAEGRGIYIHFAIVEKQDRGGYVMESYSLFGDKTFKILVKKLNRKSAKEEFYVLDKLHANKEKIYELYMEDKKQELIHYLTNM